MRMRLEDARIARIHDLLVGVLVRPSSQAFTGVFRVGMVVEFPGPASPLRGVLALDGDHRFTIFVVDARDELSMIVVPHTGFAVQRIDELETGAHDSAKGALVVRSGGAPLLRCVIDEGASVYVSLTTGMGERLGHDEFREAFLGWQLIAIDSNAEQETIIAAGPASK